MNLMTCRIFQERMWMVQGKLVSNGDAVQNNPLHLVGLFVNKSSYQSQRCREEKTETAS